MPKQTSRREFANMVGRRAAELMTLTNRVRTESGGDPRSQVAVGSLLSAVKQLNQAEASLRVEYDLATTESQGGAS